MTLTTIEADAGLYLRSWANTKPERFARLFREVLNRMPNCARRQLQEYWAKIRPA